MNDDSKDILHQNKKISKVLDSVGKIKINKNNIIETLHTIMQTVETLNEVLTGSDKKSLALESLNFIADSQTDLTNDDKFVLKELISQVAPQAIDIIIKVSNGLSDLVSKSSSKCQCF
jgi:hypothetical protein